MVFDIHGFKDIGLNLNRGICHDALQVNYDIRKIKTMLGHADIRTTMIYTHCVPSKTAKEAKSPLDF